MDSDFICPRSPSPYLESKPSCLNNDVSNEDSTTLTQSDLDRIHQINQITYDTLKQASSKFDNVKPLTINHSTLGIPNLNSIHPLRKCLHDSKAYRKFSENTLEFSEKSFLHGVSHFELYHLLNNCGLPIDEGTEEALLLIRMCSVVKEKKKCLMLYNLIKDFSFQFSVFKNIIDNWGFQSDIGTKWELKCNGIVELLKDSVICIMKLLTNSLKSFSQIELHSTLIYLASLIFDPMSVGLALDILSPLTSTIELLKEKFSMSDIDIVLILEHCVPKMPMHSAFILSSYLGLENNFDMAVLFAARSFCSLYNIDTKVCTKGITSKTLLTLLTCIKEGSDFNDINDFCYSLDIIGYTLVGLKTNKNSKNVIERIIKVVAEFKSRFNDKNTISIALDSIYRLNDICVAKINPYCKSLHKHLDY